MTQATKNKIAIWGGGIGILTAFIGTLLMIWIQVKQPQRIITNNTVMLPNDSMLAMQRQISALRYEATQWRLVATTRANIINTITGPMQWITDSMRAMEQTIIGIGNGNRELLSSGQADRERMYSSLMKAIIQARDCPNSLEMKSLLDEQTLVLSGLFAHDTIYQATPEERRRFWRRVREVFNPSM